jgi:hypothetical protein
MQGCRQLLFAAFIFASDTYYNLVVTKFAKISGQIMDAIG